MYRSYEKVITMFSGLHALVIGDVMMDSYFMGSSDRICREAPVPIVDVDQIRNVPGGAGNTALNLADLGASVSLLSACGKDSEVQTLITIFRRHGIDTTGINQSAQRHTLAKKRIMASSQLLVRYDYGSCSAIPSDVENQITAQLKIIIPKTDVVIVSDYEYGTITPAIIRTIGSLAKRFSKPVIVDAKNYRNYHAVEITAVKPNYGETVQILGLQKIDGPGRVDQVMQEGAKLLETVNARIAAITLDTEGAVIFEHGREPFRTHTLPSENSKAAGAGDTFVAAMALALSMRTPTVTAMEIAAAAASIVVQKDGTTTCSQKELISHFIPRHKILSGIHELEAICLRLKKQQKRIVFTSGYFDILHTGHIEFLEEARKRGDILIVGVNTDESMRRLKGETFPVNPAASRMKILSALKIVDYVIGFSDDTAENIIKKIQPDLFVKGGTYTRSSLLETEAVENAGGKVEILPYYVPRTISHDQGRTIPDYALYL